MIKFCPCCKQPLPQPPSPPKAPAVWKVGMKVRYRHDSEWAWDAGDVGVIIGFQTNERKNHPRLVFYTNQNGKKDSSWFYTTPADVDWIEE